MGATKRKLLDRLKRTGSATAGELAKVFDLTDVAVRQHLETLADRGLVERRTQEPKGRGRPSILWSLTVVAQSVFPERHADLAVSLVEAIGTAVGEDGLQLVIEARGQQQIASYRRLVPDSSAPLEKRVEALARQRSDEGYMAEMRRQKDGSYLLIEHNCPICDAARCCVGLCRMELEVFQETLGSTASIERTQHLLSGDQRCVYRICDTKPES